MLLHIPEPVLHLHFLPEEQPETHVLTAIPLPEAFVPAEPKEIQEMYVHPEQPEPIVPPEPIVRKEHIEAHGLIPAEAHG